MQDDAHARAALERAYRATSYRLVGEELRLVVRINEASPALDAFLAHRGVACAAFVTAANPRSRRLNDAINARRQLALVAALRDGGYEYCEGRAESDAGDWPAEPMLLVLGMDASSACALGRRFDQHGVVVIAKGRAAELRWCD